MRKLIILVISSCFCYCYVLKIWRRNWLIYFLIGWFSYVYLSRLLLLLHLKQQTTLFILKFVSWLVNSRLRITKIVCFSSLFVCLLFLRGKSFNINLTKTLEIKKIKTLKQINVTLIYYIFWSENELQLKTLKLKGKNNNPFKIIT